MVGGGGAGGFGEGVVEFEDDALGVVFAVGLLVVLPDDGEGVHHVGGVLAVQAPEMEEGGVQFAAKQEAALGIPAEGRSVEADAAGEGFEVPGGVGEFHKP